MKCVTKRTDQSIFQTYRRYPVVLSRGLGARVWDENGKEYLDFLAGIAVCNLGHCHPGVVKAAQNQLEQLIHVSNFFYTEPQAELSKLLSENSFADKIFFCNSGAEANEAALKLARKYAKEHLGENRYEVITMEYSFHGRTFATLTATGQEYFHKGFEPLLPGFKYVPFNNIDALASAVNDSTCAVMIEPIQAEGGVNMPSENYLKQVRSLCDKENILLIFDEVQVGMGRTGSLFAYQHYGVEPDIMTLAKAIAGGLPGGAMLANNKVASSFTPGSHASTFGGNPVVMAAGIAVIKELLEGGILENCMKAGKYFFAKANEMKNRYPELIKDIRGTGLIIGMELTVDGRTIVERCLEKGLIINCTLNRVLRFLPPLIITESDVDECLDILDEVFKTI